MTTRRNGGTRRSRANSATVLRGSRVCHLCGHDGADAADHKIPLARGGRDTLDNLAPAHHFKPCPVCKIRCNRVKGDKLIAPIIKRSGSLAPPRGEDPHPPPTGQSPG